MAEQIKDVRKRHNSDANEAFDAVQAAYEKAGAGRWQPEKGAYVLALVSADAVDVRKFDDGNVKVSVPCEFEVVHSQQHPSSVGKRFQFWPKIQAPKDPSKAGVSELKVMACLIKGEAPPTAAEAASVVQDGVGTLFNANVSYYEGGARPRLQVDFLSLKED